MRQPRSATEPRSGVVTSYTGLTWKEIEEMDRKADIAPPFGDTPHHIDMIAKARHAVSAVRAHCNAAPESPGCFYPKCDCKVVPKEVLRAEDGPSGSPTDTGVRNE